MKLVGLTLLFLAVMAVQVLVLTEAFGSQPGTQIQMNANRPVFFVAAAPVYSAE